jgi:hypothetical protein
MSKKHVTTRPHFASGQGGHDVTEHFEEGGRHVTCDKPSNSNLGWMKNSWMDHSGVRMSQGRIVTADGSLGGWIVWVELSLGRFVGKLMVEAPLGGLTLTQDILEGAERGGGCYNLTLW